MMDAHERIWLIDMGDCVAWHDDPNPEGLDDYDKPDSIEYVHRDLYDALEQQLIEEQGTSKALNNVLADIRRAVGDNGKLMQAELVDHVAELSKMVRTSQEERDALAAYVERLHMAWVDAKRCISVVAFPSLYKPKNYQGLAKNTIRKMESVFAKSTSADLAQRNARVAAEALEQLLRDRRGVEEASEADTVRAHARNMARRYRRQAEGSAE